MSDYYCNEKEMKEIRTNLISIKDQLRESYFVAKDLEMKITNEEGWQGEANKVLAAFLDLVVQYHAYLSGEKGKDPIQEASDTLEKLLTKSQNFYDNWREHKEMEEI